MHGVCSLGGVSHVDTPALRLARQN